MEGTQELKHKYTSIQITQYINIALSVDIITWNQIIKNFLFCNSTISTAAQLQYMLAHDHS